MQEDSSNPNSSPTFDVEWDAGDMGCGDLLLHLRFRLRAMQPGQIIKVRATDPGAPADLPAWSRLTGDSLVHHDVVGHQYYIRRKEA